MRTETVEARTLHIGDVLVERSTGNQVKRRKITDIERGKSCKGVHVTVHGHAECYDSLALVEVLP